MWSVLKLMMSSDYVKVLGQKETQSYVPSVVN